MVETARLSGFEQRVILQEAAGGEARHVLLVIPSRTQPGVPFDIGVSLLDADMLPCCSGSECVRIVPDDAMTVEASVKFAAGDVAACRLRGACFSGEGVFRVCAQYGGRRFYSNPTVCRAGATPSLFWGDPHIHTILSDCHPDRCRSLNLACIAARRVYFLDWITLADHVSNGRGSKGKWKAMWTAVKLFDDPPHFAMLPGYEESLKGGAGGDNNVYLADYLEAYVDEFENGNTLTLHERLDGVQHMIVPHHTSRPGKHGEMPRSIYAGPDVTPVVEIHSKWGTSEYRGNPGGLVRGVHDGPSFVQDLLAQGYHLGFIGGTDAHTSLTFTQSLENEHISGPPGLTAVCSSELSAGNVFAAIQRRDCYAASGQRILLEVSVNGQGMGVEVRCPDGAGPKERLVRVLCAAKEKISSIELVRNGDVIARSEPEHWLAEPCFRDTAPLGDAAIDASALDARFVYYYVRVRTQSGAQAWSSPVRFTLE